MYQRDKQLHTDNNITSKCSKIWYTSDKANLESEKKDAAHDSWKT